MESPRKRPCSDNSLEPPKKEDLNFYYDNEVTIEKDASKTAYDITHKYVDKILDYIHNEDARFGPEPLKQGSAAQRLKVGEADEFDFGVCLEGIPENSWFWVGTGRQEPRYFKLEDKEGDEKQPPPSDIFSNLSREYVSSMSWGFSPQSDFVGMIPARRNSFNSGKPHNASFINKTEEDHDSVPNSLEVVQSFPCSLPPPPPGFVALRFNTNYSKIWKGTHDMDFDGYLIPFLVKRRFKRLLRQAVNALDFSDAVTIKEKVSGPAITMEIKDKDLEKPVSVDFAPTIRVNMPFPPSSPWPRLSTRWPSRKKIKEVKEKGVNFVAKKDFDWIVSYAEAEKVLKMNIDEDGGCRVKVHRIMKKMREDFLSTKGQKSVLSSYHLKNLLFWECERYPTNSSWGPDKLAVRFNSMLNLLQQYLKDRSLPLYLDNSIDLLKDKNGEEMNDISVKIEDFKRNSSKYLRKPEKKYTRDSGQNVLSWLSFPC